MISGNVIPWLLASKALVQYADLSDITKMMNMEGGGSLMEVVNEAQKLVAVPDEG